MKIKTGTIDVDITTSNDNLKKLSSQLGIITSGSKPTLKKNLNSPFKQVNNPMVLHYWFIDHNQYIGLHALHQGS